MLSFFQISSLAICFCVFGSQQGRKCPSFFQETGEASLSSRSLDQSRGEMLPFFLAFFLIFLLGQFAFPSLGYSRDKIFSNSYKKLVRQVYSPRSLDQNKGKCCPFFKFLLGQFAFPPQGQVSQFLPRSW